MDSQLTLVDSCGPISPGENMVLTFNRDNMLDTALYTPGVNLPSYTVETIHNTTMVYAEDRLLATIRRRMFRRDQVIFPGSRSVNLNSWLKAPRLSNFPLVFHALGRQFEWKQNIARQLALYESCYPDDAVAWFSKSRRRHGEARAAHLTITRDMSEIKDMIVLSCVLAEHKLRAISMKEAKLAIALLHIIPAYS